MKLRVPKEIKLGQKMIVAKEENNMNGNINNLVINIKVKGESDGVI